MASASYGLSSEEEEPDTVFSRALINQLWDLMQDTFYNLNNNGESEPCRENCPLRRRHIDGQIWFEDIEKIFFTNYAVQYFDWDDIINFIRNYQVPENYLDLKFLQNRFLTNHPLKIKIYRLLRHHVNPLDQFFSTYKPEEDTLINVSKIYNQNGQLIRTEVSTNNQDPFPPFKR